MEELVNLIVGGSASLDVYVIVRLCVFALCLEFGAVVIGLLSGLKGK